MSSVRYFENKYKDFGLTSEHSYSINKNYWSNYIDENFIQCIRKIKPKLSNCGGGLYTGNLGIIYAAFHVLKNGHCKKYEYEIRAYIAECLKVNQKYFISSCNQENEVALLGKGGLYIASCINSKISGDQQGVFKYAQLYGNNAKICQPIDFLNKGSDEIFVGRAGYLCGLLYLKKHLNIEPVAKETIFKILDSIIQSGKNYSLKNSSPCPLMFTYHGTEYLGSGHGVAGILQIVLNFPEYLAQNSEAEKLVHDSIDYIISIQKPNGNFPITMNGVLYGESKDLVHWCHGAGGIVFLLSKAYLVWRDITILTACIKIGDLIWNFGLLKKGPGICHGIAGNGIAQLILFRLTKDEKYLYRARKFAEFIETTVFKREANTPDSPYSLYEGIAGTVCFITNLLNPHEAEFPFMPVF